MTVSTAAAEKFRTTLEKMSYPRTDIMVFGGNNLCVYIDAADELSANLWDIALRRVAAATGKKTTRFSHSVDWDDEEKMWTVSATI
jgi:hypothetical protein